MTEREEGVEIRHVAWEEGREQRRGEMKGAGKGWWMTEGDEQC